jgi:hypothetical protein
MKGGELKEKMIVKGFRLPVDEINWLKDFSQKTGFSEKEILLKSLKEYRNLFKEKTSNYDDFSLFFFNTCLSISTSVVSFDYKGTYEISNENFKITIVISDLKDFRIKKLTKKENIINEIFLEINYKLIDDTGLFMFILMSLFFFYIDDNEYINNAHLNQKYLINDLKALNFLKEKLTFYWSDWSDGLHTFFYDYILEIKNEISELNQVRICQIRDFKK